MMGPGEKPAAVTRAQRDVWLLLVWVGGLVYAAVRVERRLRAARLELRQARAHGGVLEEKLDDKTRQLDQTLEALHKALNDDEGEAPGGEPASNGV